MPKYTLYCKECDTYCEVSHSIKERPVFSCDSCSNFLQKLIGNPNIHLKGDNWTGKLLKEKELRTKNSLLLDRKQRVEHKSDKVLPNVNGEIVSSWSDAKKLAKERGYNTASYDKFKG